MQHPPTLLPGALGCRLWWMQATKSGVRRERRLGSLCRRTTRSRCSPSPVSIRTRFAPSASRSPRVSACTYLARNRCMHAAHGSWDNRCTCANTGCRRECFASAVNSFCSLHAIRCGMHSTRVYKGTVVQEYCREYCVALTWKTSDCAPLWQATSSGTGSARLRAEYCE
jgi:hypothetical protein